MADITAVFALLLAFQAKHWLADYPLQSRYMLGKFKASGWVVPLLAHVGVHGWFTHVIAIVAGAPYLTACALGAFDAAVHFVMDRIKADRRLLGRFKPLTSDTGPTATPAQWRSNDYFWYSVGLDQGVHHLTHYAVIWYLLRGG